MTRFYFELAGTEDDAQLRAILAQTPMGGDISLTFRREPSYFGAAVVDGFERQVIIARDRQRAGAIVGLGSRSLRKVYYDGSPKVIGYLSELRLLPQYRQYGSILSRGYQYLKKLHEDARAPFYFTTIAQGNASGLAALTRNRCGLPYYACAGHIHTVAIPISRSKRSVRKRGVNLELRNAVYDDLPELLDFLNTWGARRNFFPCLDENDFFRPGAMFLDLLPENILLAFRDGKLMGVLGCWDQYTFRQSIIHEYGSALQWSRRVYNLGASLRGMPKLPPPGHAIYYVTGTLPVVKDDDAQILSTLLDVQLSNLAEGRAQYLLIGFHERDPLLSVLRQHRGTWYTTLMYCVCWNDDEAPWQELKDRIPYLEIGTL